VERRSLGKGILVYGDSCGVGKSLPPPAGHNEDVQMRYVIRKNTQVSFIVHYFGYNIPLKGFENNVF
jgi:hypothetical protein